MDRVHKNVTAKGRYRIIKSVRGFMAGREVTLPQGIADALFRRNGGPYLEAIGAPQAQKKKAKRVRKDDATDVASDPSDEPTGDAGAE